MEPLLFWLAAIILLTAVLWVPHIINQMQVRGIGGAIGYDDTPLSAWAQRSKRAHENGVENLVLFAPLVLAHVIIGTDASGVVTAAMVYFIARIAHFFVYVAKISGARTVTFVTGWAATIYLAVQLLMAVK